MIREQIETRPGKRTYTATGSEAEYDIMENDHIYKICGLSRDPNKAGYIHTRIGSDEAPELAICKCKDT